MYKYFELNRGKVSSWESKGLFNEKNACVSVSALPQFIICQKYCIIMTE